MKLREKVELSKFIIGQTLKQYATVFAACSFGKDSRVVVDLAMSINPNINFISIDTGFEFAQTLSYAKKLVSKTGMNLHWAKPSNQDIKKINAKFGDEFINASQYKCCAMKLPAIKPFLSEYDAWISGLRRDESVSRVMTPIIEEGKEVAKINPIAFWTKDDVWEYIRENKLDYHPLYDQGYASLGCEPCTKKTEKDHERGGRFVGTNMVGQECGLHNFS